MSRLILVRHAMPEVRAGVAATLWGLSESAREDCVLLAYHLSLPPGGLVFSSAEPKASETADVLALRLGRHVVLDSDLREVDRPNDWSEDHRDQVTAYLAGTDTPGWEPRDRVIKRVSAAVERAMASSERRDTIVVSHGQALTLALSELVEIDSVAFWSALTLPDAWAIDLETRELTRLFLAGLPPPDA